MKTLTQLHQSKRWQTMSPATAMVSGLELANNEFSYDPITSGSFYKDFRT